MVEVKQGVVFTATPHPCCYYHINVKCDIKSYMLRAAYTHFTLHSCACKWLLWKYAKGEEAGVGCKLWRGNDENEGRWREKRGVGV